MRTHVLRRVGAATLVVTVPTLALAQPNLSGAPTATRPLSQPSFGQIGTAPPQVAALAAPLPSGRYVLTIQMPSPPPPQPSGPPSVETDAVTLTNSGGALTLTLSNAVYSGPIDATGKFQVNGMRAGVSIGLTGAATGANASGDVVKLHPHGMSRGTFDLRPDHP